MSRRKKTAGPVDALDMLEQIGSWAPPAGYDDAAKYRDFRKVLIDGGASAEQCRRVLNQILAQCAVMKNPIMTAMVGGDDIAAASLTVDIQATFIKLGEQNIGRWLLSRMMTVPRSQPMPERVETDPEE